MKRAPGPQKSLLHQVFSLRAIADEPERDSEKLIGEAKRSRFKFRALLLSVPDQMPNLLPENGVPSEAYSSAPPLLRKLGRKNIGFLNCGRLRKKLRRFLHERRSDAACEMRSPSIFVRKGVEDAEGRGSQTNREPHGRCRLLLDNRQAAAEEALDFRLFSRFRLHSNEQR